MKVVTTDQMRDIERRAADIGLPSEVLMENAGRAVAREIAKQVGRVEGSNILVLIGPGNNGGDGLVAARYLNEWGANVTLYLCAERTDSDPNYKLAQERGIPATRMIQDENLNLLDGLLASADIVVDALLGTGKLRPIEGVLKQVVGKVRERCSHFNLVAVDIPSGLNADTGTIDPTCLTADTTVTLGCPKLGLFTFPGANNTGRVITADIGIPPTLTQDIPTEVITPEWASSALPKRPLDANKGTFGRVLVVGGSINYIGAPYLACSGAIRVGAGLVTLATARSLQPILASKLTEVTYIPLPESEPGVITTEASDIIHQQIPNYNVLLIGCGLGQNPSTAKFITSILPSLLSNKPPRLILDADALNILARVPHWWQQIATDAILTPHPGEISRLLELSISEIQSRRLEVVRDAARLWHKTIVLKGAHTIVSAPDGRARISAVANPGLASAGTGDVLAGAIAGLLAQGMSLFDAASCGVYLHGMAGEMVKEHLGNTGMIASDLLPLLPLTIKKLRELNHHS